MNSIHNMIYSLAGSQPEGEAILDVVKVDFKNVTDQYHSCLYLQKVVEIKFDLQTLQSGGYTLRQILENTQGFVHDEAERFVLAKLQEFIALRDREKAAESKKEDTKNE